MPSAISTGYRKGIGTIIDANVIVADHGVHPVRPLDGGVKGFAFTLGVGTIASLFTAVVFTQAFLGVFGRARVMQSPAFLGASDEERVRWHFDFTGHEQVLLLVLRGDPADRRDRLRDARSSTSASTSRRAAASPPASSRGRERRGGADDARGRRGRATPRSPRPRATSSARTSSRSRPTSSPSRCATSSRALEDEFGLVENGFDSTTRRPDLRRAGRPQRRLRDHLLAARDLRLHGVPVRAQVRGAGAHRRHPRHPHHGRRLRPGRAGGDIGNRRGLPDHPRLLALRHRHRVRPNTRERAAPAARDLLADRQPLDERGPDPIADHGPLERLPGGGPVHLRRRRRCRTSPSR